jgi:hypothetical protein
MAISYITSANECSRFSGTHCVAMRHFWSKQLNQQKIYLWVVCYTRRRKTTSSGKNLRRSISFSHSSTSTCVAGAASLIKWNLWLLGDSFVSVCNFTRRNSDCCLKMEIVCLVVPLKFEQHLTEYMSSQLRGVQNESTTCCEPQPLKIPVEKL